MRDSLLIGILSFYLDMKML